MKPLLSIVVASYNYARYLNGALDSILAQTFGDYEVVIIDDGSTDHTEDVVQHYLKDSRFRYQRTDHLGHPKAKNQGIKLATAEYIAFLDADDQWFPRKLERQLDLFRRDPSPGVVYSRRLLIDSTGEDIPYRQPTLYRGLVLSELLTDNFICFSTAVARRAVFDRVGLLDETLSPCIDYDLWLRAALHFSFDYVDEPQIKYRVGHAGSMSRRSQEFERDIRLIMRRFLASPDVKVRLGRGRVRQAWAEHFCNRAFTARSRSRPQALALYGRALAYAPARGQTWKALLASCLPESVRAGVRQLLGNSEHDWSQRRSAPVEDHPGQMSLTT